MSIERRWTKTVQHCSASEQCDALFYAHTPNASLSRWCPWELGYFDALNAPDERVFVMAIVEDRETFKGQEYLDLYPTVDPSSYKPSPKRGIAVNQLPSLPSVCFGTVSGCGAPFFRK